VTASDLLVLNALDRDVPIRQDAQPDWNDVLARAGVASAIDPDGAPVAARAAPRRWWPRAALAFAAAVAAATAVALLTPVGGAVTRGFGGFADWLSGRPGEPAPASEQRRFEAAGERAWAQFPQRPQLRKLLHARVGSGRYTLYGFRSGNAICLRLAVAGLARTGPVLACAARSELERARDLVVPVKANVGVGWSGDPPTSAQASVSFGFVAAGVRRVALGSDAQHTTEATVANGAFLHIIMRRGAVVRIGIASNERGRLQRFRLAVARSDEHTGAMSRRPKGPAQVERVVIGGSVGWFERREPRGNPLPLELRSQLEQGPRMRIGRFARVVQPDPDDFLRLVVAERAGRRGEICTFLLTRGGIGGGCFPIERAFARAPVLASWGFSGAGQQFWIFQGVATDAVAHVKLFLANGERRQLPFRDNVVLARIPVVKMPARVVAYDRAGRVISVETIAGSAQPGPRPTGPWRKVARVDADPGPRAVLRTAASTGGGTCLRLDLINRSSALSCYPKRFRNPVELQIQNTRLATFVYGRLRAEVVAVELRYRDGDRETVKPVNGLLLHPVPARHARDGHRITFALARDATGNPLGRQRLGSRR